MSIIVLLSLTFIMQMRSSIGPNSVSKIDYLVCAVENLKFHDSKYSVLLEHHLKIGLP